MIVICLSTLDRYLFSFFVHVLIGLFIFLVFSLNINSLYILDTTFITHVFGKTFLIFLLQVSFTEQDFNKVKCQLFFLSWIVLSDVVAKKII